MRKIEIHIILPVIRRFSLEKSARLLTYIVADFLSVSTPRGRMKTSLTEWPPLAPPTGTIYSFYRFMATALYCFMATFWDL